VEWEMKCIILHQMPSTRVFVCSWTQCWGCIFQILWNKKVKVTATSIVSDPGILISRDSITWYNLLCIKLMYDFIVMAKKNYIISFRVRGAVWFDFEVKSHPNRKIKKHVIWIGSVVVVFCETIQFFSYQH